VRKVHVRWPFLGDDRAARLARSYGSRVATLMGDASSLADLGTDFGHGLTEREVRYLRDVEWARCAEDVLWRRTKLGLLFDPEQTASLDGYLKETVR
jgi:glycerol-3-phosphate dehydrogenase